VVTGQEYLAECSHADGFLSSRDAIPLDEKKIVMTSGSYDAVIVGAGPNGLAAAITLARAGWSVVVLEASETPGGGTRTAELTIPGFKHDVCSAIHPLGLASPFLRSLPLEEHGLRWIHPGVPLAHPLDDGCAVIIQRQIETTAKALDVDAGAYTRFFKSLVDRWQETLDDVLGPPPLPPKHLWSFINFGLRGFWPVSLAATTVFRGEKARAVFAGMGAHAIMPLEKVFTSGFGTMMGLLAHAVGWPMAQGGSQAISDALVSYLRSLGGEVITGCHVKKRGDLPKARIVVFDVTPRQLVEILGEELPSSYQRKLKKYRYGPGIFKIDYALDAPIPWKAPGCELAGTVHVGGGIKEIAASERAVWLGDHPEKPFVLVAQQSLFDSSRAPEGKHTLWAYCHVPNGSTKDMTLPIENQIERFAPGFRERILARNCRTTAELQSYNPNYVGGDINGGIQDWRQLFTRPVASLNPYATPLEGIYLCSSSTPPGGGVHGMCGYNAAQVILRREMDSSPSHHAFQNDVVV
jgi:phytoene dehydrogenase-like protein